MRKAHSSMILICALASFLAWELLPSCSRALDLPDEAFRLLAESAIDPCSICVQQKEKQAFDILNNRLAPGYEIKTDETCRLAKTGSGNELSLTCYPSDTLVRSLKDDAELLKVVFLFHTPGKHLVGISDKELTDVKTAEPFLASKPGTVFQGRLRLIEYAYGDGPTYNFFRKKNQIQFHCTVLELEPSSAK